MRTELRFLLAIGLMLAVLIGTNLIYPPIRPEDPSAVPSDSAATPPSTLPTLTPAQPPVSPESTGVGAGASAATAPPAERVVSVTSPSFVYRFNTKGAQLQDVELLAYRSLRGGDGPVRLIPEGTGALGHRIVVRQDTLDLSGVPFEVSPPEGLTLVQGDGPKTLTFTYRQPADSFAFEVAYTFQPTSYVVDVHGSLQGRALDRPLLLTSLGHGLAFNEADSTQEARVMAYVRNHVNEGVTSNPLAKVDEPRLEEGPFLWAAFRSKFFVFVMMSRDQQPGGTLEPNSAAGPTGYLGGLLVQPDAQRARTAVSVAQPVSDGNFTYRILLGPQNYAELTALGNDLEEVNPYGLRIFRPIVRPLVGIITGILRFLHDSLHWGYGWVLILFGLIMRVVLWPLNQKAMRAQMRNMAVQPLLKEIQVKYKDNPEKLQQEMMRLYKEYGFNPMAGCLPMLLPWPILIALFFVFQNTIEFRGVPFLWLPDLSTKDPLYILPVFLATSMFLMQYMSYKAMGQDNPQMKMMMYFMPLFFGFIFMQFAAGLNLYYSVSNIATLPQQYLLNKERKKNLGKPPAKIDKPPPGPDRKREVGRRGRRAQERPDRPWT